jgi:hypothetical protein
MCSTSFGCKNPGAKAQRRLMSNMLPVSAGQIGHPIIHVILMEPDNLLVHASKEFELV